MSLKEKITDDLKKSMISKNETRTETLRSIRAEIIKMDKSGMNREMTEEEEIQLLNRQAKMRKESIELFEKAGRDDLVLKEKNQLDIINEYLPEQISRDEAEAIISGELAKLGEISMKDFGRIMSSVIPLLKGKIDGKIIQEIVKNKIG
jgi:uncharacterized protein